MHVSGNTYRIILKFYADCSADTGTIRQLYRAKPIYELYENNTKLSTNSLKPMAGSGIDVTPVCPAEKMNTKCQGGDLPGVLQFTYVDTITLPRTSANWRFILTGTLGEGYLAGRSDQITNVISNTIMQLVASLNNVAAPNSSPTYSTLPTPFYCINILQQYNQGAGDADGDSLAFALVPGLDARTGGYCNYLYPASASQPILTTAGGFSFNHYNGQMTFQPDVLQDALIVNTVYEYRGGKLVGSSQREMTFIVRDNCDGTPPTAVINSLDGATVSDGNVINICRGEPFVSFNIDIVNPGGDSTILTPSDVPAFATLTLFNNNTSHPSAHFSASTGTLAPGNYTFYLGIKNNHCPLYNTQTIAYTVRVSDKPTINATPVSATECIHPAAVKFDVAYGFLPRTITITKGGSVVKVIVDATGADTGATIIDSLPAGTYVAIVSSDSLCTSSISFTINDSGSFHVDGINEAFCLGDQGRIINVQPIVAGATINWFTAAGVGMSGPPVVNTASAGEYNWYFIEYYKSCSSGPVPVHAVVHSLPEGQVINVPGTICFGDKIYLKAEGGVKYTWLPADVTRADSGGIFVNIMGAQTMYVIVADTFGCTDTGSVTYADIQMCCNFSYPNAFTPNDDGYNDRFRIVTWGNMRSYSLSIFNRWGQKVFWTSDPHRGWDGTFEGQPCEMGTYFYLLNAECLTGPREMKRGDVTLIR
jgi:gliding motility-associated-like protein